MNTGETEYSFSLTTFSPSGKLVQIEYALAAVAAGSTCVGIRAVDGVVLATEKKLPTSLIDESSVSKIALVHDHIGTAYSGMGADSRVLMRKGRKFAVNYKTNYGEPIPTSQIVRELGSIMQEYTQSGGVRPFGVSLLVSGFDDLGPKLYQIDPSGSAFSWKACAIGKKAVPAKTFLEKRYSDEMELEDAINTAILCLKEGFEGQIDEKNIEIGIIKSDRIFRQLSLEEVKDYLALAQA